MQQKNAKLFDFESFDKYYYLIHQQNIIRYQHTEVHYCKNSFNFGSITPFDLLSTWRKKYAPIRCIVAIPRFIFFSKDIFEIEKYGPKSRNIPLFHAIFAHIDPQSPYFGYTDVQHGFLALNTERRGKHGNAAEKRTDHRLTHPVICFAKFHFQLSTIECGRQNHSKRPAVTGFIIVKTSYSIVESALPFVQKIINTM